MLVHVKEFNVQGYTTIEDLILDKNNELRKINENSYKELYHQEHYRYRKVPFIAESEGEDNTIITDDGKIVCIYEHNNENYYSVYDLFSETDSTNFDNFDQERVHLVEQIKEWRIPKKVFLAQVESNGTIVFNPYIVYKDGSKTVFTSDMDYTGYNYSSLDPAIKVESDSYGLYELNNNDFSNFDWSKIVLNQKKYIRIHLPEIEAENLLVQNLSNDIVEDRIGNDLYISFDRHADELLREKLTFSLKINGDKPENVTVFIY